MDKNFKRLNAEQIRIVFENVSLPDQLSKTRMCQIADYIDRLEEKNKNLSDIVMRLKGEYESIVHNEYDGTSKLDSLLKITIEAEILLRENQGLLCS